MENIRADMYKYFDKNALIPNTEEVYYSPDKRYYFKSNYYLQTDNKRNWTVSKIEIYDNILNLKLFEFLRNDNSNFHGWLTIDSNCYLLLSEDLEGKSVFDLANKKFHSYSFADDKFIWCEYYPSIDSKRLAVIGCCKACPYEIRIYNTSQPLNMPYPEIYRQDNFQDKIEWIGTKILKITNSDDTVKLIEIY